MLLKLLTENLAVDEATLSTPECQSENLPEDDGDGWASVDTQERQPENLPVDDRGRGATADTPECQSENLPVDDGDGWASDDTPESQPESLAVDDGDGGASVNTAERQPVNLLENDVSVGASVRTAECSDRAFRLRRRKRLELRRRMLAFEPPPKVSVFKRIRFIPDFSDDEAVMSCDDSQQFLDKLIRVCKPGALFQTRVFGFQKS